MKTFVSPFENALQKNDLDYAKFLIDKSALNSKDRKGNTYLLYAIESGFLDIVKLLIEKGARIYDINNKNYTALLAAVYNGHTSIVDFLIKHVNENEFFNFNKFIDADDISGNTSLHLAVYNNSIEIIKILIENGANVNVLDNIINFNLVLDNKTIASQIADLKENKNYDKLAKYLIEKYLYTEI